MFSKPTRNHITIIFERLGFVFFTLIVIGANNIQNSLNQVFKPEFWHNLSDEAKDINSMFVVFGGLGFLLLVAIVLFVSFRYWQRTFFYIEGQNFIFERRTMFKKYSKLPIANIATVNVQQSIFERLVGTSKVKLDLNSSHTANRTDFSFVLKTPLAAELHNAITSLKAQGETPSSPFSSPDTIAASPAYKEPVISFTTGEVIRHKLLSVTVWQAILGIFVVFISPFIGNQSGNDFRTALAVIFLAVAGGAAALIWGILNLLGYTVEKDSKNIYINCGMIKKTSYTFEHEKINAVFVKQPVLARIFGLYSIEVAVVGLGNEKAETPQICLLVTKEQMEKVLSQCAEDFNCTGVTIPSHKAALIPAAVQTVILSLITFVSLTLISPWTYYAHLACAIVFILSALGGWLAFKTKTIAFDDNVFHYSMGIFEKKKAMFKYGDIQDTRIKTNFLMRVMHVGRLSLNILSGARMKAHRTGYFEIPNFEQVGNLVVEHEDSSVGLIA